jgi:ABC-type Fe3+ transport system permease subunit
MPLLPALIYVVVVTQVPFVVTLWYSFQSYFWNSPAPAHFTGFTNYTTVFTNPAFRASLVRSVVMTASAVIVAMLLGIAFAVLLDRKFIGRGVVRTLIITPFLVMPAAAALVWVHPRTWLGDRGHDLAVDAIHDADRARGPAKPAPGHPGGREGRRRRGAGDVP